MNGGLTDVSPTCVVFFSLFKYPLPVCGPAVYYDEPTVRLACWFDVCVY